MCCVEGTRPHAVVPAPTGLTSPQGQPMWSVLRMDLHQQKSGHLREAEKCGWERGDQGRPRQRRGSTSVCRARPAQRDREVKQGLGRTRLSRSVLLETGSGLGSTSCSGVSVQMMDLELRIASGAGYWDQKTMSKRKHFC